MAAPQEISALPLLSGLSEPQAASRSMRTRPNPPDRRIQPRPCNATGLVGRRSLEFSDSSWFEPPIDHQYTVNERGSSSGNGTKKVNVLRDLRASRPAHNGLVTGSSPAGPPKISTACSALYCHCGIAEHLPCRSPSDLSRCKLLLSIRHAHHFGLDGRSGALAQEDAGQRDTSLIVPTQRASIRLDRHAGLRSPGPAR